MPDKYDVCIIGCGVGGFAGAMRALDLGKHVFLYSDNVTLEDEVKLKQKANDLGLMVMGPDCGTAVINGVGLGFANRVRKGQIGLVAASTPSSTPPRQLYAVPSAAMYLEMWVVAFAHLATLRSLTAQLVETNQLAGTEVPFSSLMAL